MSPVVRISDSTYESLQSLAEPFKDTPDSTITRLLEFYKQHKSTGNTSPEASFETKVPNESTEVPESLGPTLEEREYQSNSMEQAPLARVISKEPDYIRQYRRRLSEPNSMPSRMLRHLEGIGSTTREKLQQDCVRTLGYTSTTSGSINASIKVLEVDGYIKIEGKRPDSEVRFLTRHPAMK